MTFDTILGGKQLTRDHQSAAHLIHHQPEQSIEEDIMREISTSLMCKMDGLKTLFNEMRDQLKETAKNNGIEASGPPQYNDLIVNHVELPPHPSLGLL